MSTIEFKDFTHINSKDLTILLNENKIREHLVEHPYFDDISIDKWIKEKIEIDSLSGCRIRAVYINENLAGWCGIQPDEKGFELAIVISENFWGSGISIFKTLISWAKELGHKEVLFHLLESRTEYKALNKIATKVKKTKLLGRYFLTYYISFDDEIQNNL